MAHIALIATTMTRQNTIVMHDSAATVLPNRMSATSNNTQANVVAVAPELEDSVLQEDRRSNLSIRTRTSELEADSVAQHT
jgi:hypothetical protein